MLVVLLGAGLARCSGSFGQTQLAFLENLAIAAGRFAKGARRYSGRALEAANEIRQIGKANIQSDIGDAHPGLDEQASRVAQARSHQILMRTEAQHARERAQEVERAEP